MSVIISSQIKELHKLILFFYTYTYKAAIDNL